MATVNSPEITVAELWAAAERLLAATELRFGSTVQLSADEYWGLFSPEMFASDGSKPSLVGRQLSDDVASIRELIGRGDAFEDDLLLWHDLNHFVGILQRISSLAG
jgi:hypothetical protein